ncbi:unnamed protein product [Lupinus luteus]|uniref:PGG domain-containing protein n=1 Tax=Lupinus luteus TaxID=3873 RepID=A0AAV1WF53_LUPLU
MTSDVQITMPSPITLQGRRNAGLFQIMIQKNPKLPLIRGHGGMLPVHLAVLTAHHEIVQHLSISSQELLHKMENKDIGRLFFMTISSGMYDVATKLFEQYPHLAVARDGNEQTALHMLARKPSEELYTEEHNKEEGSSRGGVLLQKLWSHIRQLEHEKTLDLISNPSAVLFDAVKYGNVNVVKWLLYMNRELLMQKESNEGRNILHFVILYRQSSIFKLILKMQTVNLIIRAVDKEHNNVLHYAAHLPETSSSLRSNIQMQRELVWFKEVEKNVPGELKTRKNNKGKTPKDVFYGNHKKLSDEVKDEAKGIANSGMLVATLIATVVFAAALTVPGDKGSVWFIVFILTNAVALFSSSASIVSFLSIFTSSKFTESEFIISLHPSLILGLTLLFISIATMVLAFAAASFLIFEHTHKWVAYVVTSLGILPVFAFLALQLTLLDGLLDYFYCFKRYRHSESVLNQQEEAVQVAEITTNKAEDKSNTTNKEYINENGKCELVEEEDPS